MTPEQNFMPPGQNQIKDIELFAMIRRKLRDFPALNRLTDGEENSDEDIKLAINQCFSDFNNTPPLIKRYTFNDPPPLHLLIDGTICFLLESLIMILIRNALVFNDGGITISNDKADKWQMYLNYLKGQYEAKKLEFKKSANIELGMGYSVSSEYVLISDSWGFY